MVEGKWYSTLLVDTLCPEAANQLIDEGMLENLQVHTCEAYNRATQLTQCFQCQVYGHVARVCKGAEKCTYCAGDHSTKECR